MVSQLTVAVCVTRSEQVRSSLSGLNYCTRCNVNALLSDQQSAIRTTDKKISYHVHFHIYSAEVRVRSCQLTLVDLRFAHVGSWNTY